MLDAVVVFNHTSYVDWVVLLAMFGVSGGQPVSRWPVVGRTLSVAMLGRTLGRTLGVAMQVQYCMFSIDWKQALGSLGMSTFHILLTDCLTQRLPYACFSLCV